MSPDELAAFVTARIQIAANIEHQLLSAYAALERRELYETDGCKSLGDWIQTHSYCEHHTATEQARVAAALTYRRRADGRLQYTIKLPEADGAATLAALIRQAETYGPDGDTGTWAPSTERLADAFCDFVTSAGSSKATDRATVVVHVPHRKDGETDASEGTGGYGGYGGYGAYVDYPFAGPISDDEVDLLGCHARFQVSIDDLDGHPVGIGKLSKQWPSWLFHSIWHRDGGCRFPGCTSTIGLAVHHEKPWSHPDGRTDYDGGFLLCRRHHRLRHTKSWQILGDPRSELTFMRPDGTTFDPKREPMPSDVQARLHDLGFDAGVDREAG